MTSSIKIGDGADCTPQRSFQDQDAFPVRRRSLPMTSTPRASIAWGLSKPAPPCWALWTARPHAASRRPSLQAPVLRRRVDTVSAQMTKSHRFANLFGEIIEEATSMKAIATPPQLLVRELF